MAFEDLPKKVQLTILRNKERKKQEILRRREKRKKETLKRHEKEKREREKEREREKRKAIARKKKRIYDRKRYREQKKAKQAIKKTPEEIKELQRLGGLKSMAMMRERSAKVRKKQAKINARIREKEKEKIRREKERQRLAMKRKKDAEAFKKREREKAEKAKQREKERLKRERAKERARRRAREKMANDSRKRATGNNYRALPYLVLFAKSKKITKKSSVIGKYKTIDEARDKIKECLEEDSKVIFERSYNTKKAMEVITDEYLLCRKYYPKSDKKEPSEAWLKNEFGKLVPHKIVGMENVYIIDKFRTKKEETVYVHGYDRRNDRKTFMWVYENIMLAETEDYGVKRVYLYKNKIIVRDDDDSIEIIVLKTASDGIRFYELLKKYCKGNRFLFMGNIVTQSAMWPKLEELIIEKTGWTHDVIWRSKSSKHTKKGD